MKATATYCGILRLSVARSPAPPRRTCNRPHCPSHPRHRPSSIGHSTRGPFAQATDPPPVRRSQRPKTVRPGPVSRRPAGVSEPDGPRRASHRVARRAPVFRKFGGPDSPPLAMVISSGKRVGAGAFTRVLNRQITDMAFKAAIPTASWCRPLVSLQRQVAWGMARAAAPPLESVRLVHPPGG